jgi:GAF domain-containing protein
MLFGAVWFSLVTARGINAIAAREITQAALNDSLRNRTELLHAISVAATELLSTPRLGTAVATVLEAIGKAARVDRMLVFESQALPGGGATAHFRYGWHSPEAYGHVDDATVVATGPELTADPWFMPLLQGQVLSAFPRDMPDGAAKSTFLALGIESVLLVPLVVDGSCWGHVGFDDCRRRREWGVAEIDILRTVADMLGSAIVRERHLEQLKNANRIVESSPTILFRLTGAPSLSLVYLSDNVTSMAMTR